MPIDRGARYEDPLHAYLNKKGIGEVTGGGSSLSATGSIEWVGIDIELSDPNKNIEKVARKLKELGAPSGSFGQRQCRRPDPRANGPVGPGSAGPSRGQYLPRL